MKVETETGEASVFSGRLALGVLLLLSRREIVCSNDPQTTEGKSESASRYLAHGISFCTDERSQRPARQAAMRRPTHWSSGRVCMFAPYTCTRETGSTPARHRLISLGGFSTPRARHAWRRHRQLQQEVLGAKPIGRHSQIRTVSHRESGIVSDGQERLPNDDD